MNKALFSSAKEEWETPQDLFNALNDEFHFTVVMLLPARTDTKWFHDYIYNGWNTEIRFIKGRLKFGGSKNAAPFPSMIVIFKPFKEE